MAFNFNWSPLIADTARARDMLTSALNKSPKPPIIVDDIIVNELNLGSAPPELEILEIGDLAEDRFRGIFKMSYAGDAYLTLKTRVQANPLNTYLSTKPSFASPQPLAADSGLTIPLQITLSEIRLSGFVILVFSRQKGITLVFRNDPLESLKVSSTFDSIPFVRNYLQKEIEGQLRVLFMDDLPAIIHRLSLRAFVPEYRQQEEEEAKTAESEDFTVPVDPLASPPQNATDLDDKDTGLFSLDDPTEMHASFSQKNLLRLAALTESQRTLSLFTPSIRDTVYRAWAGANEPTDSPGTNTLSQRPFALARMRSSIGSASAWSSNASETSETPSSFSRPSLVSQASASTVYTMGTNRSRAHGGRKRKHRTVNLRKSSGHEFNDGASVATNYSEGTSAPSITVSEPPRTPTMEESPEFDLSTPAKSSASTSPRVRFSNKRTNTPVGGDAHDRTRPTTPRTHQRSAGLEYPDPDTTPRAVPRPTLRSEKTTSRLPSRPAMHALPSYRSETRPSLPRSLSTTQLDTSANNLTGGILEQAWIRKIQAESLRRAAFEKATRKAYGSAGNRSKRGSGANFWDRIVDEEEMSPPPAYAV